MLLLLYAIFIALQMQILIQFIQLGVEASRKMMDNLF